MQFKKILCVLMVIPALIVAGCGKDNDDNGETKVEEKIEYNEITQAETVAYFN